MTPELAPDIIAETNGETAAPSLAWPTDRIKDLCLKIGSGVTPSGGARSYVDEGIPLLRSQNIHFDGLRLDDVAYITEETHAEMLGSQVQEHDLLLNITGASIGRCTFAPKDLGEANVNQHVCIIRPSHLVSHEFLAYFLGSPEGQNQILSNFTGASRQGLGQRALGEIRVPLPQAAMQYRIVSYLTAACTVLDGAVASKNAQLSVLESLRKASIQQAVTRGLDESVALRLRDNIWLTCLPANWGLSALKHLSEIQGGLTLGKQYEGDLIERPYLRVGNVQDGHLDLKQVTTIEVPPEIAARVELRPGDVLMTEGGDLDKLGRGFLWNGEIDGCLHQNHIFAVRCVRHKLLPKFLTYITSSRYGRDYFEATGKRTTNLASTNTTKVGQLPIPLPGIAEQARIVEYLDHRLAELRAIERLIQQQIDTLTAYRKSLIHECITGRRRVTDEDLRRVQAAVGARPPPTAEPAA